MYPLWVLKGTMHDLDNIYKLVYELRKELEKLDKAELWRFAVNAYYTFCDSRNIMDFEVGRLAYLFYKRKGGKKKYRWYSFKFNKPKKINTCLFALRLKTRKYREKYRVKSVKQDNVTDLII